ncbi:hypothetical protein BN12_950005 [Nostocoides japonicum T1-X7]|uniref:Uncharacterized protein n=1 Tax=Nostocoides japonicum T1-X7 TaxID=1194083 RepID=A0A077M5Y1_9MICO|nr:hypothetical protein BN12_950005 [Tetrasphaera japonica T1-X7]
MRSPSTRSPIIAWRRKPTWRGSVTATICMTSASRRRWTRWRTAASDRPTRLAIVAYDWRPSACSSSMMAFATSSSRTSGRESTTGTWRVVPVTARERDTDLVMALMVPWLRVKRKCKVD